MKIQLNGRDWETKAETLAALLQELERQEGLQIDAVATAINGAFAPAAERDVRKLAEGDAVEVVSPRQGG